VFHHYAGRFPFPIFGHGVDCGVDSKRDPWVRGTSQPVQRRVSLRFLEQIADCYCTRHDTVMVLMAFVMP
jgi:hypothetical protein